MDLGLRKKYIKISLYYANDRDEIKKAYMQKGFCQPLSHKLSQKNISVVYIDLILHA